MREDLNKSEKNLTKKEKYFYFILGVLITFFSIYWTFRNTDLDHDNYKEFQITIANKPFIESYKMSRGGTRRVMYIYSKDHNCKFVLSDFSIKSLRYSFSDSVEINDDVKLLLSSKDLLRLKKYKKIRENFTVYNIIYKNQSYIEIDKYNSIVRYDNNFAIYFSFVGIVFILSAFYTEVTLFLLVFLIYVIIFIVHFSFFR